MNLSIINSILAVEIDPIQVKYNDSGPCTHLASVIKFDNMHDNANIGWYLLMNVNNGIGQISTEGQFTVDVQYYKDWDGSSEYIFNHLAPALGLTIAE